MSFLLKPISFLFIIILTYLFKRAGLFKKELSMTVAKIILNITLPAVAITAFEGMERNLWMLLLVALGFGASLGSYLLMFVLTRGQKKEDRSYYLIGVSGYNVGCYGLPVINSFFGGIGTITSVMFDIGNSVMMVSGNYALTTALLKTEGEDVRIRFKDLARRFFGSIAIVAYLVLLVLSIIGISIPAPVVSFISPLASANPFLAMFMLGLLFTLPQKKSDWKGTAIVLIFRFAVGIAVSALMFQILPFSLEIRRIVILLMLCPMGSVSPAFVAMCHGDGELAAFTNSMSTIFSLILMSALAMYFNMH